MSADEIIRSSTEACAILRLCEAAAWSIQIGEPPTDLADAIVAGMCIARDLIEVTHDALVSHEGLSRGEASA